jgi:hypothetical protein
MSPVLGYLVYPRYTEMSTTVIDSVWDISVKLLVAYPEFSIIISSSLFKPRIVTQIIGDVNYL